MLKPSFIQYLHAIRYKLEITFRYDPNTNPRCFEPHIINICYQVSDKLKYDQIQNRVVQGYYSDADPDYIPNFKELGWGERDIHNFERLRRNNRDSSTGIELVHFWIEHDKYIIDLLEDQYKTRNVHQFKFGIYHQPTENYRRVR